MMKIQQLIFASTCVVFLSAGVGFGLSGRREVSAPTGQAIASKSGSRDESSSSPGSLVTLKDEDQQLRSILARCETKALWDWLSANATLENHDFAMVLEVLIDRLGWQAFDQALAIQDEKLRSLLSERILGLFALKDPWKAFELFKRHRGEFADPEWGRPALEGCVFAAAGFSADKMIEIFGEMPSKESRVFLVAAYSGDFNFRKALDFLVTTETPPTSIPENLLYEWSKRSPVESSEWLTAHPEYLNNELMERQGRLLLENIAACPDARDREQALEAAGALPAVFLDQAWSDIGGLQGGKLAPELLSAADRLGRREEFLAAALLGTNTSEKLDASWNSIPVAERTSILRAAEDKWMHQVDTPFSRRAREAWRQMVLDGWNGMN